MHDELFGHCLAALRFGLSQEACAAAVNIAFELGPSAQVKHLKMSFERMLRESGAWRMLTPHSC